MLPNLPKSKAILTKLFNDFLHARIKHHAQLPISDEGYGRVYEGDELLMNYLDEKNFRSPMKQIGAGMSVSVKDLLEDPHCFFRELDKLGKDLGDQQAKMVFQTISDITDKFGQTTKGTGGDPTPEDILEMFDKISISFNPDGTANLPSIYCGTDMFAKMQTAMEKFASDAVYQERFAQIINNKKNEWRDRENSRKLAD